MVIDFNRPNSTAAAPSGRGAVQGNERTNSPLPGAAGDAPKTSNTSASTGDTVQLSQRPSACSRQPTS
ncbi:negative regulator of flagellin synthesis FlgM [Pseudomonas sp. BAY1663]|nr:negative regulator of flagellin synthesis FlgM [Pseudomonas sp. BAY1663]